MDPPQDTQENVRKVSEKSIELELKESLLKAQLERGKNPSPTAEQLNDLQGQVDIAINQIKDLNIKIGELEGGLEMVAKHAGTQMQPNQLKEMPTNPAEITQKLLKLAEHIIVLEKEVSHLRAAEKSRNAATEPDTDANPSASSPSTPNPSSQKKPPIMPL